MSVSWELVLDVLFGMSATGTMFLVLFVKQREEYVYMNLTLLSILLFLYSLYFSTIRKKDLMCWLSQHRSAEKPAINKLKHSTTAGLHYSVWMKLNIIIKILYALFPVLMVVAAATTESYAMFKACRVLGICSITYAAIIMMLTSDLKIRFRVKIHGGTLLILTGTFLLSSTYGILARLTGGSLTIFGGSLYYDTWKQYSMGVSLRTETETEPTTNGDAPDRTEEPIPITERSRGYVLEGRNSDENDLN